MPRDPQLVVVVDNDESIRQLVGDVLRDSGFSVREAEDGASALVVLGSDEPCLILLDLRMPGMDGLGFLRCYRERPGPHAPIVMMAASGGLEARLDELELDGILPKPFDLDELESVVRRHCG